MQVVQGWGCEWILGCRVVGAATQNRSQIMFWSENPITNLTNSRHRPIIIKMMRSAANGTIERITQPQAHLCSGLTHPYQRGLNYKHLLAKRDDSISFPNHILSSVIFISNVASVSYLFMTLNKDNKGQKMLKLWNDIVIVIMLVYLLLF